VRFAAILLLAAASLCAQNKPNWDGWQFLIGDWTGEGTGEPGQGTGGFKFELQLNQRILVRQNHAEYPATKDKPAFSHEDLMVIHPEGSGWSAVYFDNEGHVIHYSVEFRTEGDGIAFTSTEPAPAPRFLLTYTKMGANKVGIEFAIAAPGKPFTPYIHASAQRK
jgi:hypothetical protein